MKNLKKDIHKLKEAARQTARWSDKVESSKIGSRVAGLKPDRGHIGHQAAKNDANAQKHWNTGKKMPSGKKKDSSKTWRLWTA